ncbi:MAG: sulfotransferase [Trueperaceae bacterium]
MRKVFVIGFENTGTDTLAVCLRRLGYRHADLNPALARRVLDDGDIAALEAATQDFDSFAGMPWPLFYRRLDRLYPHARFILTVRDSSQAWFGSLRRHAVYSGRGAVREQVYGFSKPVVQQASQIDLIDRHARQVQEYFAGRPERLLVLCWEQERSWDRLCNFLEEPVPNTPLPHEHQRRVARVSGYFRRVRNTLRGYAQRLFTADPG